jgi:hypothetical protein
MSIRYTIDQNILYKNVPDTMALVSDSFLRLRASNQNTIFSSSTLYDRDSMRWNELTSGGSITGPVNGASTLSVNAGATNKAIRQTKFYIPAIPGKTQVFKMTGAIAIGMANGATARIGSYDSIVEKAAANNPDTSEGSGHFFQAAQVSGTVTISVVQRTTVSGSQVDTIINQASWNLDKLDGTGNSGVTINFTKSNIFVIERSMLGSVKMGVCYKADTTWCHEFINESKVATPVMPRITLPIRYELTTTSAAASMTQICSDAYLEGDLDCLVGTPFSISNGTTLGGAAITIPNSNGICCLALRLNPTRPRAYIRLKSIYLVTTVTTNLAYVNIVQNPTISGPTWTSVATNSAMQFDYSAPTTNSTGTIIKNMTIFQTADTTAVMDEKSLSSVRFNNSIDGATPEILAINVFRVGGAGPVVVIAVNWEEIY